MGYAKNDKWMDEVLTDAIHSGDTRPNYEKWKAEHTDSLESLSGRPPQVRKDLAPQSVRGIRTSGRLNNQFFKWAAAAAIVVMVCISIAHWMLPRTDGNNAGETARATVFTGPLTHTFQDGSVVKLAEGARIRTYGRAGRRGFEQLAGKIDVAVAKGLGEFVVTTNCGDVKALGTRFVMELVDGVTSDTREPVSLLAVEVTEGSVEVSNDRGRQVLEASQDAVVASDCVPYDFKRDATLSARLRERIEAMVQALEAGDAAAWAANFNIDYLYKLAKGQVEYDPLRFGGSKEDAERLRAAAASTDSPEALRQVFLKTVNLKPAIIHVRAVVLSDEGKHAQAQCIARKGKNLITITTPQWHYFDEDWWQMDD